MEKKKEKLQQIKLENKIESKRETAACEVKQKVLSIIIFTLSFFIFLPTAQSVNEWEREKKKLKRNPIILLQRRHLFQR